MTSQVWLNGEFRTKPWTQTGLSKVPESPPDQIEDEVSDLEPDLSDSEPDWLPCLWNRQSVRCHRWLPESGVLYLIYQLVSYQVSR